MPAKHKKKKKTNSFKTHEEDRRLGQAYILEPTHEMKTHRKRGLTFSKIRMM